MIQLFGVAAGLLLALWLATLTAPFFKGVEYPTALAFALWFLVFSNLWTYLQQRALTGIDALFPNVRFSRAGDHWIHAALREGTKAVAVAALLYVFSSLTRWAMSVVAPVMAVVA